MAYNHKMIVLFIITILVVLIVLLISEFLWRKVNLHEEFSRKFVHITIGSFVAFWPFYLSWNEIGLLSIAFLLVVLTSKKLKIFRAIHSVQRPTWGEIFFAVAVGLITLITHNKWIFMTALLQMSLADGLAAIIGIRFGQKSVYSIIGNTKSVVGTLTFFITSLLIMIIYSENVDNSFLTLYLVGISLAATVIENVAALGMDNVLVPLLVALGLRYL